MAASDSLELVLAKAINPLDREMRFDAVQRLCQQILLSRDAPQKVLKIIAHKIQSPQEREALRALEVLETCVSRCGAKLNNEVGKFRFLNELIRVVSPKYLGQRASESVKRRIVEILYKWSVVLSHETKIVDAYQMLKRQGVIEEDPALVLPVQTDVSDGVATLPPREDEIFKDKRKETELRRLLRSKNPKDLQAANRLIKTMVEEADHNIELKSRKRSDLEEAMNNCIVFSDLLKNIDIAESEPTNNDVELLRQMFESCDKLRPRLFTLATEFSLVEDFVTVQEILQQNDWLTALINDYKERVAPLVKRASTAQTATVLGSAVGDTPARVSATNTCGSAQLIANDDDLELGVPSVRRTAGTESVASVGELSLLDSPLSADVTTATCALETLISASASIENDPLSLIDLSISPLEQVKDTLPAVLDWTQHKALKEEPVPVKDDNVPQASSVQPTSKAYAPFEGLDAIMTERIFLEKSCPLQSLTLLRTAANKLNLATVPDIALVDIVPSAQPPIVLSCQHDVSTVLSLTENRPVVGVIVVLVTTTNRNSNAAVKNYVCNISVQNDGQARGQHASGDQLPRFNAYLPSTTITQIFLLEQSRPQVQISFSLSYTLVSASHSEKFESVTLSGETTLSCVANPLSA